ncbi:hypothetical protein KKA24_01245, partial [Patescibacteria group bacterium]|nr:hypothetical protein [Patescibacteria group bacterium]
MAYAQEIKNLVADIKSSHRDRTKYVEGVKGDTHELIARFQGELKEMARDLKNFLAESEDTRKKDFDAMIKTIRARVGEIKGDTAELLAKFDKEMKELAADLKDFLAKSEANRIADFKGMMKDINADIDAIRKAVGTILADYKAERKEAAGYWGRLRGREEAAPTTEEAPAAPKKREK